MGFLRLTGQKLNKEVASVSKKRKTAQFKKQMGRKEKPSSSSTNTGGYVTAKKA